MIVMKSINPQIEKRSTQISMEEEDQAFTTAARSGRTLLQWGYYGYYGGNGRRWIYWGIPILVIGVLIFITAIAYYWVRKRRLARNRIPVNPTSQNQPVTGYPSPYPAPDYTSQYNNDYQHYNSYPQQPYANSFPTDSAYTAPASYVPHQSKPGDVEMGQSQPQYNPQRY